MKASEFIKDDISRRGFLGGVTGAAVGLKGSSKPQVTEPEAPKEKAVFRPLGKKPELEVYLKRVAELSGIRGVELAQFLAQVKHETWDFTRLFEVPKGPKYFSKKYDPKYSPRMAKILGNFKIGDGVKFYGRGFIQLTGRDNYTKAEKAIGVPLTTNPDLAATPEVAAKIAVWYWNNRVKPFVSDFSDTSSVTKKINPAQHGLESRHTNFVKYSSMF